ncbi:LBF_0142 family lipoprotein [Leptospira sp. 'Mane']|uniref:LBF_0142 family lipoprotein n=1 Tax=Leptospira sp. 'Mane' TaxID=3387407 RepID=UPI00398B7D9D
MQKNPIFFLSIIIFAFSCKLADLRPNIIASAGKNPDLQKKALLLINNPSDIKLAPEDWIKYKQIQFTLKDVWHSKLVKFFTPIKENEQRMKVHIDFEKDIIEIELLNGPNKGIVYGLVKKDVYQIAPDTGKVFTGEDEVRIYLESLRLYLLLAWKIRDYEILLYSGETEKLGKNYETVYATTVQAEATPDTDQYLAYYERETGAVEWVEFTYRELFSWYRGVIKFGYYEDWNGKLYPRRITILDKFTDEDFVHEIRIERIELPKKPLTEEQIIQEQN